LGAAISREIAEALSHLLMAPITEEDVLAGKWHSAEARQRVPLNGATGKGHP
jgi:hypothetical protein